LQAWGQVIRRYRQWKGLSRRELAARAGVSPVFLGEIERGEKDPSSHTLSLLAYALDAPISELYLRVASRLGAEDIPETEEQMVLPLAVHEGGDEYLAGVSRASDETAFDLYKIARQLSSEQQMSLLLIARSLARVSGSQGQT
jgi:transcriptional regulator with XRE-family HTH domain